MEFPANGNLPSPGDASWVRLDGEAGAPAPVVPTKPKLKLVSLTGNKYNVVDEVTGDAINKFPLTKNKALALLPEIPGDDEGDGEGEE